MSGCNTGNVIAFTLPIFDEIAFMDEETLYNAIIPVEYHEKLNLKETTHAGTDKDSHKKIDQTTPKATPKQSPTD